jgi:hypothetical protein
MSLGFHQDGEAHLAVALLWRGLVYFTGAVCFWLAAVAVYRILFHPLACIPGPRLAAVSNIWYAIQVRNGRTKELGRTLHRKYGPVVRVGPDELWFDSMEACKVIYGELS